MTRIFNSGRWLYNLLLYLILPIIPLRLLYKSRKNISYRKNIAERFSFYNFLPLNNSIWVHVVSVGESVAATPLIFELLNRYPALPIVVTTMTPTGADYLRKKFDQQIKLIYVPYDYPLFVKRFLSQINPRMLILMETEIWPNIIYYSHKREVPIIIANACLSPKSFRNYKKLRSLICQLLNMVTIIATQGKMDTKAFIELGADPEKILEAGSVKYDIEVSNEVLSQAKKLRSAWGEERPIFVAASTHPGEENKILAALKIIYQTMPDVLLILVPRHPERFNEVFGLCSGFGLNAVRYSENPDVSRATNVIVGDVMGQLLLLYAVSDVAFVGGSLVAVGGHNLLEPAAFSKPILSGKNLDTVLETSQYLTAAGALIKVGDEISLANNLLTILQDKTLKQEMGKAALEVLKSHGGATKKILDCIANCI